MSLKVQYKHIERNHEAIFARSDQPEQITDEAFADIDRIIQYHVLRVTVIKTGSAE